MKTLFIVLVAVVAFFLWLPTPDAPPVAFAGDQEGNGFVLRDVRVFDGERFHERRDVVVQDGMIIAVSPRTPAPEGLPEYDGSGHTLLPGLIDAHTHNFGNSRREALNFGVTTQIDMFSMVAGLSPARTQRESLDRTGHADMWSAGTLVTAPGGHGTQFGMEIPALAADDDVAAYIAARIAEGSDFIKLVLEPGDMIGREMATLSPETLAAAIAATHAHGKLAVVHVSTQADAVVAVEAGADGLVHLFGDSVIEPALVATMRERGVFVIPTLAILESVSGQVSALEQDARIAPYLDPTQRDSLTNPFPGGATRAHYIRNALASVRLLHEAGVPVLAGSDAPNPGTAHGASIHRELELLAQGGLTPAQALAAATAASAHHFGLEDRGQVTRGMRADLVLVAGDPSTDITATRDIVAIWKNGYRVERVRFDGPVAANPPVDQPRLGEFDTGDDGWMVTTDSIQGGSSRATQTVADGVLTVTGEVRGGALHPWAGAIRTFAASFAPTDASAYTTLELRIRGDGGPLSVLLFSGAGGQAPPAVHEIAVGPEWTTLTVAFTDVAGVDAGALRAVAVAAGPDPRTFRFELDSVVLR